MSGYAELSAINTGPQPDEFARLAGRIDLIIGKDNRGRSPYGTAFENVRSKIERATVYEMQSQGHLAHIHAPRDLALLINTLAGATAPQKSCGTLVSPRAVAILRGVEFDRRHSTGYIRQPYDGSV
jgi:hypothetical protein